MQHLATTTDRRTELLSALAAEVDAVKQSEFWHHWQVIQAAPTKCLAIVGNSDILMFADDGDDPDQSVYVTFPAVDVPDLGLLDRLKDAALTHGITVTRTMTPHGLVQGQWLPHSRTVVLIGLFPPCYQVRTLVHELAHAVDPWPTDGSLNFCRRDVVAEAAAYLVGTDVLGIDTREAAAFFIANRCQGGSLVHLTGEILEIAERLSAVVAPAAG